jgi:NAD(P)-dependent dehydrogenase (short-subunit alcohol dehydrogenase family)
MPGNPVADRVVYGVAWRPAHPEQLRLRPRPVADAGDVLVSEPVDLSGGARPSPGTAAYGAAKAGLQHLVTSRAIEWGPAVRINCVVPGFVATEAVAEQYGDPAVVAAVAATVPLGRLATPDDVAQACLFLASAGASYVSGACLTVHGGGEPPAFLSAGVGSG